MNGANDAVKIGGDQARGREVLVSSGTPDYSIFTNGEIHILASVANYFESKTAREISELSHKEPGFQETCDGQIISYEFADGLVGVN